MSNLLTARDCKRRHHYIHIFWDYIFTNNLRIGGIIIEIEEKHKHKHYYLNSNIDQHRYSFYYPIRGNAILRDPLGNPALPCVIRMSKRAPMRGANGEEWHSNSPLHRQRSHILSDPLSNRAKRGLIRMGSKEENAHGEDTK